MTDAAIGPAAVSVVIPCHGHAHFLGAAIESVIAQTSPGVEIVVVDDGSPDDTATVAASYDEVILVRQENAGLSAARNAGLAASSGDHIAFLDADDRLLPGAIADGLAAFRDRPDAVFVAGGHRRVDAGGRPIATPPAWPIDDRHAYVAFLRGNWIGMHAAVLYRRDAIIDAGGFDPDLPACEDYDLYLRLTREHTVHQYSSIVAEYRWHGSNMSADIGFMLANVLAVLGRQIPHVVADPSRYDALREGLGNWTTYYRDELGPGGLGMNERSDAQSISGVRGRAAQSVDRARRVVAAGRSRGGGVLRRVGALRDSANIDFGDLRRLTPISEMFGFDRGRPIDRVYIENFLARHSTDIRGRALEIGDDTYIRQYGGDRVDSYEVLHVDDPTATYVGTLEDGDALESGSFDCIVLTQTLHLIFDISAALATVDRILAPGGVLLATVPGVSQMSRDQWSATWSWSLSPYSMQRLIIAQMPDADVTIESRGNVLTSVAFLHGLAESELTAREIEHHDPAYPLVVTARVEKAR